MRSRHVVFSILLCLPSIGHAEQEKKGPGHVQIPLDVYNHLVEAATKTPRPAPARYALGRADVNVSVSEVGQGATATVSVSLSIEVFESEWTLVPVIAAGTGVVSATVGGNAVRLVPTPLGLAWSTNKAGAYTMSLTYNVDAVRSGGGFVLALPVPQASVTKLDANLPGSNLDVTVIPSSGARVTPSGQATSVTA
ncbi:MAG: hypothetical protein V3T05_05165, partial [Myxococcota bacterium]